MQELKANPISAAPPRWGYALLAAAAFAVAAATKSPALTDWDSWEYAALAIAGHTSDLCLGRWWFIFFMRLAWQAGSAFGLSAENGFVVMQWTVAAMTAGAVMALAYWTWLLTRSRAASLLAGAMAVLSPTLAAYSSAVMTEAPTVLFLGLAMILWELALRRAEAGQKAWHLALLGGYAFGIVCSMREPAVFLAAWPAVSCLVRRPQGRWRLLAIAAGGATLSLAVAVGMVWQWNAEEPWIVLARYSDYMKAERQVYGFFPLRNAAFLLAHFALACPPAVFALVAAAAMRRGAKAVSPTPESASCAKGLKALALSTLPYVLMTWWNPDMWFNYRLLLPLAWMWIPVAAGAVVLAWRRRRILGISPVQRKMLNAWAQLGVMTTLVAGSILLVQIYYAAELQARIYHDMRKLPEKSAIIAGCGSPVAIYLERTHLRPQWFIYPTAGSWTEEWLTDQVTLCLRRGWRIFVNTYPTGWTRFYGPNHEWQAVSGMMRHFGAESGPGVFTELTDQPQQD